MALITFGAPKPYDYTKYTILGFPSWKALADFAQEAKETRRNPQVDFANANFKIYINRILSNPSTRPEISSYGLFGKAPKSYDEAMSRETFLYYDEYKKAKERVEKMVEANLQKKSAADVMKPKFVFNDKQIGEFIFDRAAMSLQPEIYYYSFAHKREVDIIQEKVIQEGNVMLLSDGTVVVYAIKVEKDDGTVEYIELKGDAEKILAEASSKGIIDCSSSNKKVYLYKEKKPKYYKSVKIIVGMTAGGFTNWQNDFYTGLTACIVVDVLESLGYSVQVEVVMGGGRCGGCYKRLKFGNNFIKGRRFFSFTAKSFNDALDLDGLLYTLCDPSFHNVKFISLLNYFFSFFGDQIDGNQGFNGQVLPLTDLRYGCPNSTWHGIGESDMLNPIGTYFKWEDYKKGNKDMLLFSVHKVPDEDGVVAAIMDIVLTAENQNLEILKKMESNAAFGLDTENND